MVDIDNKSSRKGLSVGMEAFHDVKITEINLTCIMSEFNSELCWPLIRMLSLLSQLWKVKWTRL